MSKTIDPPKPGRCVRCIADASTGTSLVEAGVHVVGAARVAFEPVHDAVPLCQLLTSSYTPYSRLGEYQLSSTSECVG
ncbi:hypothetical protein HaLaN_22790, partial [Haematococcus lacustris]